MCGVLLSLAVVIKSKDCSRSLAVTYAKELTANCSPSHETFIAGPPQGSDIHIVADVFRSVVISRKLSKTDAY